jgi:hypothetical protein
MGRNHATATPEKNFAWPRFARQREKTEKKKRQKG